MAKRASPPRKKLPQPRLRGGFVLTDEALARRERVFAIYRDMGRRRSLVFLERELNRDYPELKVVRTTLEKWSRQHQWQERCKAHDEAVRAGVQVGQVVVTSEFDQVATLTSAAHAALIKAISATPVITKPSELKAMIDAAANALKLAETISKRQGTKEGTKAVVEDMKRILVLVDSRKLKNAMEILVKLGQLDPAKAQEITTIDQLLAWQAEKAGQVDAGVHVQVDGEPEIDLSVGGAPIPASQEEVEEAFRKAGGNKLVAPPPQPARLPLFADLIKSFNQESNGQIE